MISAIPDSIEPITQETLDMNAQHEQHAREVVATCEQEYVDKLGEITATTTRLHAADKILRDLEAAIATQETTSATSATDNDLAVAKSSKLRGLAFLSPMDEEIKKAWNDAKANVNSTSDLLDTAQMAVASSMQAR